jgi:hypothetical protein
MISLVASPLVTSYLFAYLTSSLTMGCGYSSNVKQYIEVSIGTGVKAQYVLKGAQGETARHMVILSDDSWYLTYEFLKDNSSYDITCIVAAGPVEKTSDVSDFHIDKLPDADIGIAVRRRPVLTK